MPDKFEKPTITRSKIPPKDSPSYDKLVAHIADLDSDHIDTNIVNLLTDSMLFDENMTMQQFEERTEHLNKTLGSTITKNITYSFIPGVKKVKYTREQKQLHSAIGQIGSILHNIDLVRTSHPAHSQRFKKACKFFEKSKVPQLRLLVRAFRKIKCWESTLEDNKQLRGWAYIAKQRRKELMDRQGELLQQLKEENTTYFLSQ